MRRFGELESLVMDRVWSEATPCTVRQVLTGLRPEQPPAYTTVMTVMDNLYRKGALHRHRDGRAYVYSPSESREEHDARLMTEVLETSSDRAATLLNFVGKMSPGEVAQLRELMAAAPEAT